MKLLIIGFIVFLVNGSELFSQQLSTRTDKQVFHWLALGDSYTIGESVGRDERFPAQTARLIQNMQQKDTRIDYIAGTGWTTADLQEAITKSNLANQYDLVTVLIGVNDQYQGLDTGGYRKRFTRLLQTALLAVQERKERVWVISIPDYSATPFGRGSEIIHREIEAFNRINFDIACQYQVPYCNITGISLYAANDPTLTAADKLHPSAKQYQLWAIKLSNAIGSALQ